MITIIISGTPGTGKTSVSTSLVKKINAELISLNKVVIEKDFGVKYDIKRDTLVTDIDKTIEYLIKKISDSKNRGIQYLIIESNFSDIVPNQFIDHAFVLRCHPEELYKRLKLRKYNEKKIKENIQAEILGNCANYLIEKTLDVPILELDTTSQEPNDIAELIYEIIEKNKSYDDYKVGKIDWMEVLFQDDQLLKYFD